MTNKKIEVKIPNEGDVPRKIEYISFEEIAEAMLVIIKKSFSIQKNDLFVTTSRVFGFNRTGKTITAHFEKAFNILLVSKKIIEREEKISINN